MVHLEDSLIRRVAGAGVPTRYIDISSSSYTREYIRYDNILASLSIRFSGRPICIIDRTDSSDRIPVVLAAKLGEARIPVEQGPHEPGNDDFSRIAPPAVYSCL